MEKGAFWTAQRPVGSANGADTDMCSGGDLTLRQFAFGQEGEDVPTVDDHRYFMVAKKRLQE